MGHYDDYEEKKADAFDKLLGKPVDQLNKLAPPSNTNVHRGSVKYGLDRSTDPLSIKLDITGVPLEMFAFLDVINMGAEKHGNLNFLDINGKKSSHKDMHDSMFHHLSMSFANKRTDEESGLDHLLHLATRALMAYTRIKRGIKHDKD